MFKGLRDEIIRINSDVNDVANSEKAKKLRKKLLRIGIPLLVIGAGGALVCFMLFAIGGFTSVSSQKFGFSPMVIIPFVLAIPLAIIGTIGATITAYGMKIVITGYSAKLTDETVGFNCPKCGESIEGDQNFCPKCGSQIKVVCKKCNATNDSKNTYCEKCGEKLEK